MEFSSPSVASPPTVTVRRNPPRRARPTPSTNLPLDQIPSKPVHVSSFPTDEIMSIHIPKTAAPSSENLKVYLRIRPLQPPQPLAPSLKSRGKNVWPQNPKNTAREKTTKKKSGSDTACLLPVDAQSVTLSPPIALKETRRIKSEVYGGFSHVFPSDSSQHEVYEKMVKALVDDFLEGKSGMLAALGPSGSGKTHTVFGTVRQPGMVPLALRHIFKQTEDSCSKLTRSFSLSIFEISSERGKVERISDLTCDRIECSMQQSTIKGLQEVPISDAGQAESLIACALLKRATAMTNSNSQSSRSQCIINIHSVIKGKQHNQPDNSVLTIVDLAGAEREKKTGNQGSRLLESNFINNTSMVFGLCLRSLLEHQKNPKKPLQKHFQGSLLTRYLRDYLEGRKRMTLILTVRPGEADYYDTNYLLRQASPFMQIKFSEVEEPSNLVHNKRHIDQLSRAEQAKRMKFIDLNALEIDERKTVRCRSLHSEKETQGISKSDYVATASKKSNSIDLKGERNHQIMQSFAKALWNVLKQYKEKLTLAESEIQSLNENLGNEKSRYLELEKELDDLKSRCTCSKAISTETTLIDNSANLKMFIVTSEKCGSDVERNLDASSQTIMIDHPPNIKMSECASTSEKCDSNAGSHLDASVERITISHSPILIVSKCISTPEKSGSNIGRDLATSSQMIASSYSPNTHMPECIKTSSKCGYSVGKDLEASLLMVVSPQSPNLKMSEYIATPGKCASIDRRNLDASLQEPLEQSYLSKQDAESTQCRSLSGPDNKAKLDSTKSLISEKPKRRLLPASSVLLRDITAFGLEDEPDKAKGNRGAKKSSADETSRTQGSICLLRLLQNNLRL